jgi:tetratricopeptide (TPR) repeat protein
MRLEGLRDLLSQFPDVDGFWDSDDLGKTENLIREKLPTEGQPWGPESIVMLTLLARAQGLQGKLSDAGGLLIQVRDLLNKNNLTKSQAEVRFFLEQGRFFGLSMNPPQSLLYFTQAWDLAASLGDIFFAIEAAVMLSISQPPKYQNQWLLKALEIAEQSDNELGKLWLPQLYVMEGWHSFDFRKFDGALDSFKKALAQPLAAKDATRTLGIKWSIGRTLRALNRLEEALELQRELLTELNAAGKTNGYVVLEIAENLQLMKKPEEAKANFEAAYKELSTHGWYSDNKASELSRIQHLSKKR